MIKIVVATSTCNFKSYAIERVVFNNLKLNAPSGVELLHYLSVELTGEKWEQPVWAPELTRDLWGWFALWQPERSRDQDEGYRLPRICMAYNMAVEYGRAMQADAILFVDGDVLVPACSVEVLWNTMQVHQEINVISGLVPGRGCHSNVCYTGSTGLRDTGLEPAIKSVDYATCGFMMVRSKVFWNVPFRWGSVPDNPGPHSVDPLFGHDIRLLGYGPWYVHIGLKAEHLDNPKRPLSNENTSRFE